MLLEVIVRAVGDAPQLAPAEREEVFKVRGRLGIEGELVLLVVAQAELFTVQAPSVSASIWRNAASPSA